MVTLNQLVRNPRIPKKQKPKLLALKFNWNPRKKKYSLGNNSQKSGICKRVWTNKPKKPNSAQRSVARVKLSNGKEITIHIPGEKHGLQEYSLIYVKGGRAQDLPGVKYSAVRGRGDLKGVEGRKQGRSLYGTKKVKQ